MGRLGRRMGHTYHSTCAYLFGCSQLSGRRTRDHKGIPLSCLYVGRWCKQIVAALATGVALGWGNKNCPCQHLSSVSARCALQIPHLCIDTPPDKTILKGLGIIVTQLSAKPSHPLEERSAAIHSPSPALGKLPCPHPQSPVLLHLPNSRSEARFLLHIVRKDQITRLGRSERDTERYNTLKPGYLRYIYTKGRGRSGLRDRRCTARLDQVRLRLKSPVVDATLYLIGKR
ncbi:hypothetical protein F4859DRAFT_139051 [Xylaria cf. heliscus]|nr:hypothetical protein F4859DRAFT_139051 [Xylaria cf. heliscus]